MSSLSVILAPLAKRYIAGLHRDDAVQAAKRLNGLGIKAAIDCLGENVRDEGGARASVDEYTGLLVLIDSSGVDANISLKLTHMGLDVSEELAASNAGKIVESAGKLGNFVRFDMEGSPYTQKTMDIYLSLRARHPNVGIAVQSYLKRSREDIRLLIEKGASVRLVKGAYREAADIAFADKADVDGNFSALMKELLLKGNKPAIATHDERLINEAVAFARDRGIPSGAFEFEMLLGIKRELQRKLAFDGYNVRVYCPYGTEWLPYTLRRLRERRENIYFVLRHVFE